MYPSRRQNRSPLISDCFHMLSKTVKNTIFSQQRLSWPFISQHLFQVGGKGSENVHETTSSVSLQIPCCLLWNTSQIFTYSPECTATVNTPLFTSSTDQCEVDDSARVPVAFTCSQHFFVKTNRLVLSQSLFWHLKFAYACIAKNNSGTLAYSLSFECVKWHIC